MFVPFGEHERRAAIATDSMTSSQIRRFRDSSSTNS